MRRWIVNILAAVSVALFAAFSVLLVRSHWVFEGMFYNTPGFDQNYYVGTFRGWFGFMHTQLAERFRRGPSPYDPPSEKWVYNSYPAPATDGPTAPFQRPPRRFRFPGFVISLEPDPATAQVFSTCEIVAVADYWPLILSLPFPLLWLRRTRRQRRLRWRKAHGLCLVCGYDLRATPDRCPECGTAPQPA